MNEFTLKITDEEARDVLDLIGTDCEDDELNAVALKLQDLLGNEPSSPSPVGVYLSSAQIDEASDCNRSTADKWVGPLNQCMADYDIDNRERISCFMAQICHESGSFKWVKEIWGPTSAQKRYEGRADLGNTQPGDGKRFMGRGLLQLTGRANYRSFTKRMRQKYGSSVPDFEAKPELVEQERWAVLSACDFWDRNNLNPLADGDQITNISKRVNGGTNGLDDRKRLWRNFLRVIPK